MISGIHRSRNVAGALSRFHLYREIVECSSLDGWVTSIRSLASLQWASRKRRGENSLNNPSIEGRTDLRSTDPCVRCDPPSQINELSSAATLAGKVEEKGLQKRDFRPYCPIRLWIHPRHCCCPPHTHTECTSVHASQRKKGAHRPIIALLLLRLLRALQ